MIEKIDYTPDCFSHLGSAVFYAAILDGEKVFYFGIEKNEDNAHVHLSYNNFNKKILKLTDKVWVLIKGLCRGMGCKRVIVSHADDEGGGKFLKYIKRFGFSDHVRILVAIQEV